MYALTLSSLALALGPLAINAKKTSPGAKHIARSPTQSNKPPPFYDWEHRTTCVQEILNPMEKDVPLKLEAMVVGYAWDETNALQPDHKWNWNSTANANKKIRDNLNYAGTLLSNDPEDYRNGPGLYAFQSGKPDDRGYTQFTVEFSIAQESNLIEEALNIALGIEYYGWDDDVNIYTSIFCIPREDALPEYEGGLRHHYPGPEELRYMRAEDEILLQKQRYQQLHTDRRKATDRQLAKTDEFIQENAGKAPKKTLEMEESDRKIQAMAQGKPPRVGGSFTA